MKPQENLVLQGLSHAKRQSLTLIRSKMCLVLSLWALWASSPALGQNTQDYSPEQFIRDQDTLAYRLASPTEADQQELHPLLIFLHGSGERGTDNKAQLIHGGERMAQLNDQENAFVLLPQCPPNKSWHNGTSYIKGDKRHYRYPKSISPNNQLDLVYAMIEDFVKHHRVDPNRIYIGGLSMGGMGTLAMLRRHPNYFAGAFAICGGAHPKSAKSIKHTPLWLFHGTADQVVLPQYSEKLYKVLKRKKAIVAYTSYPEVGHDSWTNAFAEPALFPWLFAQQKAKRQL